MTRLEEPIKNLSKAHKITKELDKGDWLEVKKQKNGREMEGQRFNDS